MKKMLHLFALSLCVVAVALVGCASDRTKAKTGTAAGHQRGWIGGEYELALKSHHFLGIPFSEDPALPGGLAGSNRAGLLIAGLSTNAPAWDAGLRESDLIIEVGHAPVTTMKAFRKVVDGAAPGTALPVRAWREGKTFDCGIVVGRERFMRHVDAGFVLPFYGFPELGRLDLWPNPGFSLGCLAGYEQASDKREELWSAKGNYRCAVTGTNYTRDDTDWNAWLLIFWSKEGRTVQSQERFSPTNEPASSGGR